MSDNSELWTPPHPSDELREAAGRLRKQVAHLQVIEDEAKRQLEQNLRQGYFIGISGCTLADENAEESISSFPLDGKPLFSITPVTNIPDIGSLARALTPHCRRTFTQLDHLSRTIRHELYIAKSIADTPQSALNLAYRVISLLRLKSGCLINAVSFSDTPWGQLAAHSGDVFMQPLEDARMPLWGAAEVITKSDLDWVSERLARDFDLYEQPSYRLAYDAAADAPFLKDSRTAVARIWSGIESLFDVHNELSFRLSMYAAILIEDEIEKRIETQARFKRLYGLRSKAVHGAKMEDAKLAETLKASWHLLRDLLVSCIRSGPSVPSTAVLDQALLGRQLMRKDGTNFNSADHSIEPEHR
ncbi:hypothetical protein [Streptomyces sp. NBC_01497]|uniref:hypothetical protein n=1 Tax=Streptomyces sp. NBC_01497 TaxID=2903885 RepID=UPI002E325737|nr:hypothetical protein [Streptomyces sp. NBC_01497]